MHKKWQRESTPRFSRLPADTEQDARRRHVQELADLGISVVGRM